MGYVSPFILPSDVVIRAFTTIGVYVQHLDTLKLHQIAKYILS